jgi:hypothetical protein
MEGSTNGAEAACSPPHGSAGIDDKIQRYCYESLPGKGKWIRVLHLHPNPDRIDVSLKEIEHTEGQYKALSYVWGSPETIFKAFVLDFNTGDTLGFIPLTTNLHNILCNLRDSEDVVDTVFWIDQICIGNKRGKEPSSSHDG